MRRNVKSHLQISCIYSSGLFLWLSKGLHGKTDADEAYSSDVSFFSAFPGKTHQLQMYDSMTLDGMAGQPTPANVTPSEIKVSKGLMKGNQWLTSHNNVQQKMVVESPSPPLVIQTINSYTSNYMPQNPP